MSETPEHVDPRPEPPFFASEREMLEAWLEFHRATFLAKCEGLSDAELRTRSVPPSTMSLLGLARHLTEVERNWLHRALVHHDVPAIYSSPDRRDADFDDVDDADAAQDLTCLRDEIETCRRVAAAHPDLDAAGRGFRDGRETTMSLRWIYVHMIEEYARHNGHADLLRERIDGATGV